jgi:hypothetical protein
VNRAACTLIATLALSGCLRELLIVDEDSQTDEQAEAETDSADDECGDGQVECGDQCVSLASDVDHCGACDIVCLPGQTCTAGECELIELGCNCDEARELCVDGACECRPGLSACGASCVDVRSDVDHCGGCGQPCAGFCVDGECEEECEEGKTLCGTACVDLDSDPLHCEECGETCDPNEVCVSGKCRDFTFAGCESCPCDCGLLTCCESLSLDAVLCVYDGACPP